MKIYFVEHEFQATEKVFVVEHEFQADVKAFEVEHDFLADVKAYRVDHEFQADRKVFLVAHEFLASGPSGGSGYVEGGAFARAAAGTSSVGSAFLSSKKSKAPLVIGVLAVLGLGAGALAFFSSKSGDSGGSSSTATSPRRGSNGTVPVTGTAASPTTAASAATPKSTPSPPAPTATPIEGTDQVGPPLRAPEGIGVLADGSIVVADSENHLIRQVFLDGTDRVLAGVSSPGFSGDGGPANRAAINAPEGVAVAPDGSVLIADWGNHRVRRISPDGTISTIAGNGVEGSRGDGGPAVDAELNDPIHLVGAADGSVYFADNRNYRIRRISPNGIISTVAGTGARGFSGDGGPATEARLDQPQGIALGADGSLIFSDTYNHRVRRISPDGIITTIAGNGRKAFGGDNGPATAASLNLPVGLAIGADGRIFVADFGNNRIRVITPDGIIQTLAGNGQSGSGGDGGSAVAAQLTKPQGVAVLLDGSIVVTDTGNDRIRIIRADGTIVALLR